MVRYEVMVTVEPHLAADFAAYMRDKHIPEIDATGCFQSIRFEQASPTLFRTCYEATAQADVDRYLNEHTAHFRADFAVHFPAGVTPERQIWHELQQW